MKLLKQTLLIISMSFLFVPSQAQQLEQADLTYDSLRYYFNLEKDNPLIISIYGAACVPCLFHRNDIYNSVIQQCDNPDLRWFIIWFEDPGHPATRLTAETEAALVNDPRITQWWYTEHSPVRPKNDSVVYKFGFAQWMNCVYPWDISMIFEAGVEWTGTDPPPAAYCMSKSGCCNSYNLSAFVNQVNLLDICDASPTGLDNFVTSETNVYPNPSTGIIYVDLINDGINLITVTDINGSEVYQHKVESYSIEPFKLEIDPALAKGVYLITVKSSSNYFSKKLIIE